MACYQEFVHPSLVDWFIVYRISIGETQISVPEVVIVSDLF
jgi:hypothetical protein